MRCRWTTGLRSAAWASVAGTALWLAGCTTPASVSPLMDVVERVLADEQRLLDDDAARQQAWLDQQRAALAGGFEADLADRELTVEWVRTHTTAYVAAREALLDHERDLDEQRATRRQNLAMAAQLQRRARVMLARQDELLGPVGEVRQWFERITSTEPETER